MTHNDDYRKYLEERFTGISAQITSQNDMQDIRMKQMQETLNDVLSHVKITNGRVNNLENIQSNCPRNQVEKNTKELDEINFIKKYFKTVVYSVIVGVVVSTIATLKSFGVI